MAEFKVFEVATTAHYGPGGEMVCDVGTRVEADPSRPLPYGWVYDVERVADEPKPEPTEPESDDDAWTPTARRGRRGTP